MVIWAAFPDIEKALVEGLGAAVLALGRPPEIPAASWPNQVVVKDSTSGLDGVIAAGNAFCRITKVGGTDDVVTDYPAIEVEFFAPTRAVAYALSEQARRVFLAPGIRVGGVTIDQARTSGSPRRLPWDNEKIQRVSASYRVAVRR